MPSSSPVAWVFEVSPNIRYVAVNQDHRIVEMIQSPRWPSRNPTETDRMEELVVNPIVLEATRRRGEIDLSGVRFVIIRYGPLFELLFPYPNGHLSVGVEPGADIVKIAEEVETRMSSASFTAGPDR